MKLKDRVALITGASRGIGRAVSLAYAKEGADLVLVSRTRPEIEEVARQVEAFGRRAVAVSADVSNPAEVESTIRIALQEFGRIDILVNNAGIQGPIGLLADNNPDEWIETIKFNLVGPFLCMHSILPIMMKQRKGKIICLSGGGATSPRPYFSAYAASKVAIVRLVETLAAEVKGYNIEINAIAPGSVNTRMLDLVLKAGASAGEKAQEEAKRQLESGGVPPETPASLAVFLASDDSNGLTGRLISAVWDNWKDIPLHLTDIKGSDVYTLRRIVPGDRQFKW